MHRGFLDLLHMKNKKMLSRRDVRSIMECIMQNISSKFPTSFNPTNQANTIEKLIKI
jgi:hypothetical protein